MKRRAFLYIVLAGIFWGTSGIFVKFLSPYGFLPSEMSLIRGFISFSILALYSLIKDRSLFKINKKETLFVLFIGACLFGTATCYYTSMQMTSVATAVVLMYTAPIYVTVFSILFFKEKFLKLKLFSIAVMLIGCAFVSGVIGGLKFDLAGILIGALSGIIYASYNILTKISLKGGTNSFSLSMYSFLFMTVIALFAANPMEIFDHAKEEPILTIPLMAGLGIFTFVVPYFLYTLSMKELDAATASALSIIEPLAATLFSIFIFGDMPDVFSSVGIILIIAAVFLLGRSEKQK